MNRFCAGLPVNQQGECAEDAALLRRLAERYAPRGTARLGFERRSQRRLEALLGEMRALRRGARVSGEALERLDSNGRLIEALGRQAAGEGGARLPAWRGRPRIEAALAALCTRGGALTKGRLLSALAELDGAQALTQEELWAVPEALRTVLARELLALAGEIADRGRRCAHAQRWARRPRAVRLSGDAAFLAHALKTAGGEGLSEARRRLDDHMAKRGLLPERLVAQAQGEEAALLLRLEGLMATRRMLEGLNWQDCFCALSRVEIELQTDPSGVYPRMDEDSHQAVRGQVAHIASRTRLSEPAVARCAVDAARSGAGVAAGVCWWLYDDAGRRALCSRLGRSDARLRRLVPDPSGRGVRIVILTLAALCAALLAACAGTPWLWPACALLGWSVADLLVGRFYARIFAPARLLKLELDSVPEDCRTLVTMPVLLSSPERAEAICDQLEALGCLETSENIEYLLLGDFADAGEPVMPSDGPLLEKARERVAAMNARAGREKYALLCRPRSLLKADGVWMGRDRKRGALMDLNRLLLGEAGAEDAFAAEDVACQRLRGRFEYVVTLDADTRVLPGDVRRLIGAMAHPLNHPDGERGYAVLQPRMELLPSACTNAFVRVFAGVGGVNAYPIAVSNLWQDLTGRGIYAGKGIYHVAAFQARLAGALPQGRVLSHDLVEGAVAGAAFVGDVALYDGHPTTFSACLARQHRWTRGDWQLLGLLLSRKPLPNGRALSGRDRFLMLENLVRSLRAPALLTLWLYGVWSGGGALPAALALSYLEPLLHPGDGDGEKWRRATAELATLPLSAWNALDAVLRTLWRLTASGKRLLEWVTSADAEAKTNRSRINRLPNRLAFALLLPAMLGPGQGLIALALGVLFLVAPAWVEDMQAQAISEREPLTDGQREVFERLARQTWLFFADNVACGERGSSPLPPDNVQLDPPVGAARRTSPTNIALYLMSCLSARRLGFIDHAEYRQRVEDTLSALERMEKWKGQLYNWYDIDTLAPLRPRYVSSVDSGNLAAALLLCAAASETGETLARRLRALARGMELSALYDGERELFFIGMDVEAGRVSTAHYDLLASEARILSFTAMLLNQVPTRHWRHLGRACARVGDGATPLSWSGTMFEYLMPRLFLAAPPQTLLGEGVRAAVRAQIAQGKRLNRPWGVSESGYGALDAALNYQYRAFGLPELALDGEATAGVVAPYAAALAAMVEPEAAARNLRRMGELGWQGDWGLYEAADYLRPASDGSPSLVKSHMAHHQGMILCALCNALTGDSLRADFMGMPEARALSLLLEERPCPALRRRLTERSRRSWEPPRPRAVRRPDANGPIPETHLLSGGGATALCTDDGAVHYWRDGIMATRFSGALQNRFDAARTYLTEEDGGGQTALARGTTFEPGIVRFEARVNRLKSVMTLCLSPEDGTLLRVVEIVNRGDRPARCAVTDVVPVALASEADWSAHAVFQNLFVESDRPKSDMLVFRHRPGSRGAAGPRLAHLAIGPGELSCETDYERLAGRLGDAGSATVFDQPLDGGLGATLNPASALRMALKIDPGRSIRVCFVLRLTEGKEDVEAWRERWLRPGAIDRTIRLAGARAGAMLDFIGLSASDHQALQRMAALLTDGTLAAQARDPRRDEPGVSREALWAVGVSGDRPMLALYARRPDDRDIARELIRAHEFYRAMGLKTDLILVDDGEMGYARPVRDMLENLVSSSHLNRLRGTDGGVWLLDGASLSGEARRALNRFASATFASGRDFYAQVRALTAFPAMPRRKGYGVIDAGASLLKQAERLVDNGFGGFSDGGYEIDVLPERLPPAPWCNVLANEQGGALLSERGGGFFWRGNSRGGRLTPYGNDALREGWGLMLYLVDDGRNAFLRLLPGDEPQAPFRVTHSAEDTCYALDTEALKAEVRFAVAEEAPETHIVVELCNRGLKGDGLRLVGYVDWLMGTTPRDSVALSCWQEDGACLATGAMAGVGWFAAADALAQPGPGRLGFLGRGNAMAPEGFDAPSGEGWTLSVPLRLKRGEGRTLRLALGWSEDVSSARARIRAFRASPPEKEHLERPCLSIETPNPALNALANGFLLHQVRASRVLGRTGLYQPGGAWGFRDQLQDMLALLQDEPERVRAHLLRCAARQFEAGDVLHWWHEPFKGVRTRVSDDLLFLPWVTAAYVRRTGDREVLNERVPYLADVPIPEGEADVYREMEPGETWDTLHGHCMRAFRRASAKGKHGLLLMGTGDWNDGMNRVGAEGRGESVWLTQFAIACADSYRAVAPSQPDQVWLWRLGEELRRAVEAWGWDGNWYLRAYDDDGVPLGSAGSGECRIDAISQAWAVLAGLDVERCRRAMDAAWENLADEEAGIIRLLTPPFEGRGIDPGYIRGYPAGVRENGGQYTHGALWLLLALIRMGDGERAHRALGMLLPFNHSDTPEKAALYRVEPYVMAADVYDRPGMRGRGGWTWYTGAAGWMYNCLLALLGYERRGDRVSLNALLGDWPQAGVTVPFGGSTYRLICDKDTREATLDGTPLKDGYVHLIDDGKAHEARFPERERLCQHEQLATG